MSYIDTIKNLIKQSKFLLWSTITDYKIQIAIPIILGIFCGCWTLTVYNIDTVNCIALTCILCSSTFIIWFKNQIQKSILLKMYTYIVLVYIETVYSVFFPQTFSHACFFFGGILCFYASVFALLPNNSAVLHEHLANEFKGFKCLPDVNILLSQVFLICIFLSFFVKIEFTIKFLFFFSLSLKFLELIVCFLIVFYCNTKTAYPLLAFCKHCVYFAVASSPFIILESTSGLVEPTNHFAREWIQYRWLRYTAKTQSGLMAGQAHKLILGGLPPTLEGTSEINEPLTRSLITQKLKAEGSETLSKGLSWPFGTRGKDEE